MGIELFHHINVVVDNAYDLLEEYDGQLTDRQAGFLKIIVQNITVFNNLCEGFVNTPLQQITVEQRHQLGNPLTPVLGYAELLAMGSIGALNPKQQKSAQNIYQSALTLRDIVETMVQAARAHAVA